MSAARHTRWLSPLTPALGLGAAACGLRAAEPPDPLLALPGELHSLASLGRCAAEGRFGAYRVIVLKGGVDGLATRLAVQWLRARHPPGCLGRRVQRAFFGSNQRVAWGSVAASAQASIPFFV